MKSPDAPIDCRDDAEFIAALATLKAQNRVVIMWENPRGKSNSFWRIYHASTARWTQEQLAAGREEVGRRLADGTYSAWHKERDRQEALRESGQVELL